VIPEDKILNFHNVDTLVDEYIDYAKDIDKKKIDFSFDLLYKEIRGLRVQELMTVIAGAGIGKSALALNFLMNFVKRTNELTVLFSLEMSTIGIGERIFQIELDKFGYEIESGFVKEEAEFIQECRDLKTSLNNFIIVTDRIEVHKIPDYLKEIEKIKEKKVRLVGIDYVGLMENNLFMKDEYLRTTDNMKILYAYAKKLDIAIINLSQTSRADVKGTKEGLSIYSGKGSGEVENSSDFLLTLERIDEPRTDETDKFAYVESLNTENHLFDLMRLTIQKNRRGKRVIIYVIFNRKNLRIKEFEKPPLF